MRIVSLALTVALFSAGAALAADPPPGVEPAFGNTIVSTYPDGRTAKAWLHPDGTYTGQGRRGGRSSGRWAIKGDRVCMRQSRPIPFPKSFCTPLITGAVGTRWPAKAVSGEVVMMSLVEGQGER